MSGIVYACGGGSSGKGWEVTRLPGTGFTCRRLLNSTHSLFRAERRKCGAFIIMVNRNTITVPYDSDHRGAESMTSQKIRVVLQARTTSSRLPAKVLLPLGGMPLAILCAKRLGSSGREVILATSNSASDDFLAATATQAGVRVLRGSLDDILDRFLYCTSDLKDDDLVVRATADNPFPDGNFIEQLISAFEKSGQNYLEYLLSF